MPIQKEPSNDWLETSRGYKWNPQECVGSYSLHDLTAGVSRICRFNGQIRDDVEFYSVAEHLCLLYDWAEATKSYTDKELRTLIAHDLPEGLIGDMVRPLKHQEGLSMFSHWEERLWHNLCDRYDMFHDMPEELKALDTRILKDERRQVMARSPHTWYTDQFQELGVTLQFWLPAQARFELRWRLDKVGIIE